MTCNVDEAMSDASVRLLACPARSNGSASTRNTSPAFKVTTAANPMFSRYPNGTASVRLRGSNQYAIPRANCKNHPTKRMCPWLGVNHNRHAPGMARSTSMNPPATIPAASQISEQRTIVIEIRSIQRVALAVAVEHDAHELLTRLSFASMRHGTAVSRSDCSILHHTNVQVCTKPDHYGPLRNDRASVLIEKHRPSFAGAWNSSQALARRCGLRAGDWTSLTAKICGSFIGIHTFEEGRFAIEHDLFLRGRDTVSEGSRVRR